MRLDANDLREINLFKYYRLVRRWACKTYDLKDADLELLIYLDCKQFFTRNDFINGVYTYSWDKARWERLRKNDWIDVFKERNRTNSKYAVYKVSAKSRRLINRIYKVLLGQEDLPTSQRSVFYKNKSYTDKVYNKAIDDMVRDKER
jgi:ADP-heptose:LPS heptosyltransferase|tara:strand:- start:56 stop:496 length:441 start_codon:yes stop_codon:yes gene_type:complete